jgi:hypothetical protein
MTAKELLILADKALHPDVKPVFAEALNARRFTQMRNISERCLDVAKDELIENAIKEYCDPVVTSHYKISNDLLNETLEFIIVNSDVN